jgi:ketosteroid isomerase-like protein
LGKGGRTDWKGARRGERTEQANDVASLTERFYEAMSAGDVAAIENLVSSDPGAVHIGTDPTEWWEGHDAVIDAFRSQMEQFEGMRVVGGKPRAYKQGDVAWAVDRARFALKDGTEVPIRITVVYTQEGGTWKAVHSHASIGVANEEALP